ncbi:hypothetical protein [Pseudomonas putida]|uniref:hypothetical protein n=1 Tax=Pseudomonas putida TaxID=303 RepID=UPI0039E1F2EE
MTILFRPQGAFGWFSYTTSRDTIGSSQRFWDMWAPRRCMLGFSETRYSPALHAVLAREKR